MNTHAIAHVALESQQAWSHELQDGNDSTSNATTRLITIRCANSQGQRSSANILVNRMYGWRGYHGVQPSAAESPSRITLVANDHDSTIGTLTVGFDSDEGLHVDDLFAQEAHRLRDAGHSLCEFTKLAVDNDIQSRRVLASLFNVAYLYAHRLMGFDTLLIEVNPRHVRYYQRMLGFKVMGPQRLNRRVNAPAVLLGLDFAHSREQILRFAGLADNAAGERSLYPYFFSPMEEHGILNRLSVVTTASLSAPEAARTHRPELALQ